jgi:hypothetical protein
VEHLVDREAEDVAVHRRHPLQAPVVCLSPDHLVDFFQVLDRAAHQILGVVKSLFDPLPAPGEVDPRVRLGRRPLLLLVGRLFAGQVFREVERVEDLGQRAAADVALEEHLDRHLPCRAPLSCRHMGRVASKIRTTKHANENKGRSRNRERPRSGPQ